MGLILKFLLTIAVVNCFVAATVTRHTESQEVVAENENFDEYNSEEADTWNMEGLAIEWDDKPEDTTDETFTLPPIEIPSNRLRDPRVSDNCYNAYIQCKNTCTYLTCARCFSVIISCALDEAIDAHFRGV